MGRSANTGNEASGQEGCKRRQQSLARTRAQVCPRGSEEPQARPSPRPPRPRVSSSACVRRGVSGGDRVCPDRENEGTIPEQSERGDEKALGEVGLDHSSPESEGPAGAEERRGTNELLLCRPLERRRAVAGKKAAGCATSVRGATSSGLQNK